MAVERALLGHEFLLSRDTADTWGTETWSTVKCRVVDDNLTREKVDVTRRGAGNMQYAPGLLDEDLQIQIHYRKDATDGAIETHLSAYRDHFNNRTSVICALSDGAMSPAAGITTYYTQGQYYVTSFTQSQDINGDALVNMTLAPADTDNALTLTSVTGS